MGGNLTQRLQLDADLLAMSKIDGFSPRAMAQNDSARSQNDWAKRNSNMIPSPGCRSLDHVIGCGSQDYVTDIAAQTPHQGTAEGLRSIIRCATSYRQTQIFARQGVVLDRSARIVHLGRSRLLVAGAAARAFVLSTVLTSPKVFADDTTLPVLDPGRGTHQDRTTVVLCGRQPALAWAGISGRCLCL